MKYFIIICSVIIVFMIWVLIPRKKKEDDSEEDFHTVEEDSRVPHTHNDSLSKFVKKIKDKADQKKESQSDKTKKNDDYTPYQPPCGTCAPSCGA
ncbi:MAG: hypothetical protein II939_16405 [Bacteroidales bacterium]|nr:hypothetical protein [Bacteroidales bacterium]